MQRVPTSIRPSLSSPCRGAFTMVELLVAIMILAILSSLIVGVLGTTGEKARINATKATIGQIDRVLQERYQKFLQEITTQERNRLRANSWDNILGGAISLSGGSGGSIDIETAKVLIKEDRYRGWFPQRVGTPSTSTASKSDLAGGDDIVNSPASPNPFFWESPLLGRLDAYAKSIKYKLDGTPLSPPPTIANFAPQNASDTKGQAAESAEVLYFLVTEGADGINSTLKNDVNPRHIGDTDDDGLPEFLDDWGHPLRFYNAPTSMYSDAAVATALMPGFTTSSSTDPLDPGNLIGANASGPNPSPICTAFPSNYHAIQAPPLPSINFIPLIVSAGADEDLGLFEPNDPGGPAASPYRLGGVKDRDAAMDNITNRQTGAP